MATNADSTTSNFNNTPIDTVLDEIDKLFKTHYLGYKDHNKHYEELITEIEKFKNNISKKKILISINEKINELEIVSNHETNIWGILFVIVGLFISILTYVYLDNYNLLLESIKLPLNFFVCLVMFFVIGLFVVMILYCLSINPNTRKLKKKCYYKFVYDILSAD